VLLAAVPVAQAAVPFSRLMLLPVLLVTPPHGMTLMLMQQAAVPRR
jgi:hypothetical protein